MHSQFADDTKVITMARREYVNNTNLLSFVHLEKFQAYLSKKLG